MNRSLFLLAFLALCATKASADLASPEVLLQPKLQGSHSKAQDSETADDSARERELQAQPSNIYAPGTTPIPASKIVGPVIGGVVGAGALAGVIAISVMKKPEAGTVADAGFEAAQAAQSSSAAASSAAPQNYKTSLVTSIPKGATSLQVQDLGTIGAGDTIKVGTEYNMVKSIAAATPGGRRLVAGVIYLDHPMNEAQGQGATVEDVHSVAPPPPAAPPAPKMKAKAAPSPKEGEAAGAPAAPAEQDAGSSGDSSGQSNAVTIGLVLLVGGCLCLCLVAAAFYLFGRKKKRKTQPRKETPEIADYNGSAYVKTDEEQALLNRGGQGDAMAQTQDLMSSQYMQVSPPAPVVAPLTAALPTTANNIGSIPTMQNVVPMVTMPPTAMSYAPQPSVQLSAPGSVYQAGTSVYQAGTSVYQAQPASVYQNASPLTMTANYTANMPTVAQMTR